MTSIKRFFPEDATHMQMLEQLQQDMLAERPTFDPVTNLRLRGLVTTVMAFNALADKPNESPQMVWERLSGLSEVLLATHGFIAMSCTRGYQKAMLAATEITSKPLSDITQKPDYKTPRGELALLRRSTRELRELFKAN